MIDELNEYLPINIDGIFYRIVEAQEINATRQLVDTLDEHELLENMIESSKPTNPYKMDSYHYLLSTPFRYPPLNYGSRFGAVHEPSLLYASIKESTCIAECAFYRLNFYYSMTKQPPKTLKSQHTLFTASFQTSKAIDLTDQVFSKYTGKLIHKSDYSFTQRLGSDLRNKGFDCVIYTSARDPSHGLNIALYNPSPLKEDKPISTHEWYSEVSKEVVQFKNIRTKESYEFHIKDFFDDYV
ncbi:MULTISPECIES: RES family NAD+ phosphorylase [Cysteiniphilum]|uniref:RES domain-containing protein n=1 Tax=Cysteiniphilum litorale TaxID=2056700 RepID=A0A8J2Z347_9GAMM|nr:MULTISPECIES: RES family NAD+ phosphorylase [Cysteiniphilum]GGF91160.1 hypothetical protein GCM10010995_05560 [Cysteiniphilum litorale]